MRRVLIVLAMMLSSVAPSAEAVTAREIIELTRAGLGEDVLLALIEVNARVYSIDPEALRELKEAGVSERVILAMVRSGRTHPVEAPMPPVVEPPEPQVVVIEHERPVVREVAVPIAVPVYIPVVPRSRTRLRDVPNPAVPVDPFAIDGRHHREEVEPVYWGWGGKLRPDAWKPANHPKQ